MRVAGKGIYDDLGEGRRMSSHKDTLSPQELPRQTKKEGAVGGERRGVTCPFSASWNECCVEIAPQSPLPGGDLVVQPLWWKQPLH